MISETTDSWITFKVIIFIDDFGKQYSIFDKLNENVIIGLEKCGVSMASTRISLLPADKV